MRIFLSGMMGTGKTTVGAVVAKKLGLTCIDLDQHITKLTGRLPTQIFAEQGESAFREVERDAFEALLDQGGQDFVLALGGGTLMNPALRKRALASGTVVTLSASVDELEKRVQNDRSRPLLAAGAARDVIARLLDERKAAYAECHGTLSTIGQSPEVLAEQVIALSKKQMVVVALGERTYRVSIAQGVLATLGPEIASMTKRAVIVTDQNVAHPWADQVEQSLSDANVMVQRVVLTPGEAHKNLAAVEQIWNDALSFGVDRRSMVIGVGGGVVGDLAGFAGSTLLRGLSVGQMPTTLLSMVDSAVGGKTGFDVPQGKNLIGTFQQPAFVVCDINVLSTLPEREYRSGMAEAIKSAWLDSEGAVCKLEADVNALKSKDPRALIDLVKMAITLKARVVTEDERETLGTRMLLNFGHTLGHAIEAAQGYGGIAHGEAVALGMVAAAQVAVRLGRMQSDEQARLINLLRAFALPVDFEKHLDTKTLAFMSTDKKRQDDNVSYVIPERPGVFAIEKLSLTKLEQLLRGA